MSSWRSKSSNKKSDSKQISNVNLKSSQIHCTTHLSVPNHINSRASFHTTIIVTKSKTNFQNDEGCQFVKNQKQTPITTNKQSFTLLQKNKQIPASTGIDTSIDWEQIVDQVFQSLDLDADGYLSVNDLESVLKNFSHLYNSDEILLRIFKELDLNNDQRISKQEFKLYKKTLIEREQQLQRASFKQKYGSIFTLFDHNRDNYITRHEIRETMHNLGEHIDDDLIDEMMQTADIDHDGRISRDEFEKLLTQLHSPK